MFNTYIIWIIFYVIFFNTHVPGIYNFCDTTTPQCCCTVWIVHFSAYKPTWVLPCWKDSGDCPDTRQSSVCWVPSVPAWTLPLRPGVRPKTSALSGILYRNPAFCNFANKFRFPVKIDQQLVKIEERWDASLTYPFHEHKTYKNKMTNINYIILITYQISFLLVT